MVPTLHQQSDSNRRVSTPRSGFTLLEGLVVLAIVLLLIALLLPNVRQGGHREGNQRRQTRYDLKMIGLALHNYHDAYGVFPPAVLKSLSQNACGAEGNECTGDVEHGQVVFGFLFPADE
jgi:prepilin-type N-terminal cleavage/methylation domain-containing protein